jgi:tight adherence protein B
MRRLLALVAGAAAFVALAATPAAAEGVTIRSVDTTDFPVVKIRAIVTGPTPDLGSFTVRENGRLVSGIDVVPLGRTAVPVGIVLVIDTSGSMRANGAIDAAKAAARQFVAQKQPNDQVAIVAFSDEPRLVTNFTADAGALNAGIDSLAAAGETALWDGVRLALGLYNEHPELQPNLVVLSDGRDTVSKTPYDQAKGAALAAKAVVFTVGLQTPDFDEGAVRDLAESTGGQYLLTTDPSALGAAYASVQRSLQNQYEVTYRSSATGTIDVTLSAGGRAATVRAVNTGTVSQGSVAQPEIVEPPSVPGFLTGTTGKVLAAALALAAAGLLAYGIGLIVTRESSVEKALQPYTEGVATGDDAEGEGAGGVTLAETAVVQRAVEVTTRLARERGVLQRVEALLEQADLPIQAGEALFFYLAAVVVLGALGLVLGGAFGGLAVVLVVAVVPWMVLGALAAQRRRKFTALLPDTLTLLAGTLRAGYSLLQGVEAVSQEVEEPMGKELRRVLAEARLGRPLEDALTDCADRMGSPDFDWAVMAIKIQREVGGNLAELLNTVADTMLARERLRREVRALTAEGRISAVIIGILPVGLGVVMYAINPDYMRTLFDHSIGKAMVVAAGLLALVGFYWMKKTIEIEV